MNNAKISNLKDLLGQLEYVDNVIKCIEENAEKMLSEKSEVSLKIKINYPETSKHGIFEDDGSLMSDAHRHNFGGLFQSLMHDMRQVTKKEADVKIEISDRFAIEIFSLIRIRAKEEQEKILKKLNAFE